MPDTSSIRILLADDSALIRECLTTLFKRYRDLKVVAEAANGLEAIAQYRLHVPDITLMDVSMPFLDGLSATSAILKEHVSARIILFSTDIDEISGMRSGASAILTKDMSGQKLIETIRAVHLTA